jgi:hypothetical protein
MFTKKRTTTYFLYLSKQSLLFKKHIYKFTSPGDLTKYFKQKHLAYIKGDRFKCKVYQIGLQNKQQLQNHALSIHGTISWDFDGVPREQLECAF